MRNAGGAGRYAQQAVARLVGGGGRFGGGVILRLALRNGTAERLRRFAAAQPGAEIGVQKEGGQLGQHLHVQVIGLGGGGNHHQHLQRLAVRCVAGQRRVQRQRSQLQLLHGGAFGVGNGQPIAHADAAQRQPGADIRHKHGCVCQIFGAVQQRNQLLDSTLQRVRTLAQCNTARLQIVGDAHGQFLPYQKSGSAATEPL